MYNSGLVATNRFYHYSIDFLLLLSSGFCIVFGAGRLLLVRSVCFIDTLVIIMHTALADWMTSKEEFIQTVNAACSKTHLFSSDASCLHWGGKWSETLLIWCWEVILSAEGFGLQICTLSTYKWSIKYNIFSMNWKRFQNTVKNMLTQETSKLLKFKGLYW